MYKNILIATDGSEFAGQALKHGLKLAKTVGATVTIVTVTDLWSPLEMAQKSRTGNAHPTEDYEAAAAQAASKILAAAQAQANKAGIKSRTTHIKDMHPAEGIAKSAATQKADLIIMASHGRRGLEKVLMGSVAAEVITHSKVPVLVVRPK